jgi:hypothetical protein
MAADNSNALSPDALVANQRGELSDAQLRGFRALSRDRRKSALSSAAFLVAGALLIGFFASPSSSPVARALISFACLAIAAFLVVRSITGADALTRDLRRVQVQFIEGAIGKRRVSGGRARSTYFLEVGDARFTVGRASYQAAPDAGHVRLYYLPLSRKVVNLERLPNPAAEHGATAADIVHTIGTAVRSHSQRERNEARANLAGVGDAMKAAFAQAAAPPGEGRDPRPLGETILGTWSNGFMTIAFSGDGTVTTSVLGREKRGRWSIDADGRLRADVMGREQAAEAWVASNQLTISAEGQGFTFTRDA